MHTVGSREFMSPHAPSSCVPIQVVHKISLYTTVFKRWDEQLIYVPNEVLTTKYIYNVRRSAHQWHFITLEIDAATPMDVIEQFERRLGEEVRKYPSHLYPNYDFGFGDRTEGCRRQAWKGADIGVD